MNTAKTLEPSRKQQLDAIVQMSIDMLDLARDQVWEKLEQLEVLRRDLVGTCFQSPAAADEAQMMADYISRILDINREITVLTEAGRQEAGQRVHSLGTAKQAHRAYSQHAR